MTNFVYQTVQSRSDADDLTQEVFLKVYRAAWSYRPTARFSTWLYRIATNTCLNHLRSGGRHASRRSSGRPCSIARRAFHCASSGRCIYESHGLQTRTKRSVSDHAVYIESYLLTVAGADYLLVVCPRSARGSAQAITPWAAADLRARCTGGRRPCRRSPKRWPRLVNRLTPSGLPLVLSHATSRGPLFVPPAVRQYSRSVLVSSGPLFALSVRRLEVD